jgi:hypothetical protein
MKMNSSVLLITCLLCLPLTSHATAWPIFKAPTLTFLQDNNLIDTAACPAGEGRISPNLLLKDFNFQRYDFQYVKNGHDEDETLYTTTTAYYGKAGDTKPVFAFTFTSEKDDHWQCSELSAEYNTVICANDI